MIIMIAIQVTAHGVVIAVLTVFGAVARPVVAVLPVDGKEMRVVKMYSYKPMYSSLVSCYYPCSEHCYLYGCSGICSTYKRYDGNRQCRDVDF